MLQSLHIATQHNRCDIVAKSVEASASADRRAEDVRIKAVIVAELELSNIQRKVLFTDFVECADAPAFDQRPKTLNRVGVHRADNILAFGMVNDSVRVFLAKVFVADPLVCDQQANFVRDGLVNESLQCGSADVLDHAGDDVTLALYRTNDDGFAGTNATRAPTLATLVDMFATGFATNESFVHFNDAAELFNVLDKRSTDLVAHEPSGFVGTKAHVAHDLQCAHALFARQHEVDDAEPVAEWLVRVLKDRPGDMGEPIACLRSALVALPIPRLIRQLMRIGRATARAMDALGPTTADKVRATGVLIGEHVLKLGGGKLLDRLGLFAGHDGNPPVNGRILPCPI
jgi:hypothetical protein